MVRVYAALLILCLTTDSILAQELPSALTQTHPVVTDGDTLKFGPHLRVRLYGIDAPELEQACDGGSWPAGRLARETLKQIIEERPVICQQVDWDSRWSRPVSRCTAAGRDLSEAMVVLGMAWAFVRYSMVFVRQESAAKKAGIGIHGHSCRVAWEWRQRH